MIDPVTLPSRSGAPTTGVIGLPEGNGKAPAVVLLQEWWGVNGHIRSLVERLSREGFIVLAPDLYHGAIATNPTDAQRLMNELQWPQALDEIAGALAWLKADPRSTGHVGITGFCMGGAGTLLSACAVPGFEAAVAFYGLPPAHLTDWKKADVPPIQAHFASTDEWARPERAMEIRDTLVARGKVMELHVYDAQHAFMNDTRPEVYHPTHAATAWKRMVDFFHRHLG